MTPSRDEAARTAASGAAPKPPDPEYFVQRAMTECDYRRPVPTLAKHLRAGDLVYRPPQGLRSVRTDTFPPRRNQWYVVGISDLIRAKQAVAFQGLWPPRWYDPEATISVVRRGGHNRDLGCSHLTTHARHATCSLCGDLA